MGFEGGPLRGVIAHCRHVELFFWCLMLSSLTHRKGSLNFSKFWLFIFIKQTQNKSSNFLFSFLLFLLSKETFTRYQINSNLITNLNIYYQRVLCWQGFPCCHNFSFNFHIKIMISNFLIKVVLWSGY